MINGLIAVKTGPVKFDREHQSKGGGTKTIEGLTDTYESAIYLPTDTGKHIFPKC